MVGSDGGFVIFPDENTLVAPDVSFIADHREPLAVDQEHFARLAPDLIVEVMSPTDWLADALLKVSMFLQAGVPLVWLIDPFRRTAMVFQPDKLPVIIDEHGVLHGEEVLPGFTLPLAKVLA